MNRIKFMLITLIKLHTHAHTLIFLPICLHTVTQYFEVYRIFVASTHTLLPATWDLFMVLVTYVCLLQDK